MNASNRHHQSQERACLASFVCVDTEGEQSDVVDASSQQRARHRLINECAAFLPFIWPHKDSLVYDSVINQRLCHNATVTFLWLPHRTRIYLTSLSLLCWYCRVKRENGAWRKVNCWPADSLVNHSLALFGPAVIDAQVWEENFFSPGKASPLWD